MILATSGSREENTRGIVHKEGTHVQIKDEGYSTLEKTSVRTPICYGEKKWILREQF